LGFTVVNNSGAFNAEHCYHPISYGTKYPISFLTPILQLDNQAAISIAENQIIMAPRVGYGTST
jgi:hypothetical protein